MDTRYTQYKVTVTFLFAWTTNGACEAAAVDKERTSGCKDNLATFTKGSTPGSATQSAAISAFLAAAGATEDTEEVPSHLPLPLPFLPLSLPFLPWACSFVHADAPCEVIRQIAHWCV